MSIVWLDEAAVLAATAAAKRARAELIAERDAVMGVIAILEERRQANHFGDGLQVTFRRRGD